MPSWLVTCPQSGYKRSIIASSPVDAMASAFPNQDIRLDRQPNVLAISGNSVFAAYVQVIPPPAPRGLTVSVQDVGAQGDSTTEDSGAIQAAINYAISKGGGTVWFEEGGYLCNAATLSINHPTASVKLKGAGVGATSIFSNTLNQGIITVNGTRHSLENLLIYSNQLWTSGFVVQFLNAVQCKIDDCWIQGGFIPLAFTPSTGSSDCILTRSTLTFGAGGTLCLFQASTGSNGGHHIFRSLFNQAYPVQVPTAANYKTRTDTTAYNVGDIVIVGSYFLQCSVAGTTGVGAPTVLWYGNLITDGTVRWLLMGNTAARGIQFDTLSALTVVREVDVTGAFSTAIDITNTLAGTAPTGIKIRESNADGPIHNGINFGAGKEMSVSDTNLTNPTGVGPNYGILVNAGVQVVGLRGNEIYGFTTAGIGNNGNRVKAIDNTIAGGSTGLLAFAGVTDFIFADNICGSTTGRGANSNAITVQAGASDRYSIVNNSVNGATTGVTDGGTGVNKTVASNF